MAFICATLAAVDRSRFCSTTALPDFPIAPVLAEPALLTCGASKANSFVAGVETGVRAFCVGAESTATTAAAEIGPSAGLRPMRSDGFAGMRSPLSDGHKHARALRLVAKAVLRDLWIEARRVQEIAE